MCTFALSLTRLSADLTTDAGKEPAFKLYVRTRLRFRTGGLAFDRTFALDFPELTL
jgi:hypothetical protein